MTNADFNSGIFNYKSIKKLINKYGKSNKQIAEEIKQFVYSNGDTSMHRKFTEEHLEVNKVSPKFYGYYSAYDHVVLCWLFGKMNDLPNGFPMYTIDLKQELDRKVIDKSSKYAEDWHNINIVNDLTNYPKQIDEHNALADAKWNKELYEFLQSI